MSSIKSSCLIVAAAVLVQSWSSIIAQPLGTAFTYQGRLNDNDGFANGAYDLTFSLYGANSGGSALVGPLTNAATSVSNGLFAVALDFGGAVINGASLWLEIGVRPAGGLQTFTTLSPRQPLLAAPYLIHAASAGSIMPGGVTGPQIADGQVVKSINGLNDNLIVSAGNNITLTTNGNTLQFSGGIPNMQVFSSSRMFTLPAGVNRIMVEVWGGGGGGGSGKAYGSYQASGGGGGGGGFGKDVLVVTPGTTVSITVGIGGAAGQSGGASSFGDLIFASGGGAGGSVSQASSSGAGGSGSTSSATFNSNGAQGSGGGIGSTISYPISGSGHQAYVVGGAGGAAVGGGGGGGGQASIGAVGGNGGNGVGPGGGGGGGGSGDPSYGQAAAGGSGGNGRVVVYW